MIIEQKKTTCGSARCQNDFPTKNNSAATKKSADTQLGALTRRVESKGLVTCCLSLASLSLASVALPFSLCFSPPSPTKPPTPCSLGR